MPSSKIEGQRVPIQIWTDLTKVEDSAMAQLKNVANLPFVFKHVAVMPDVHYGIGATVGSVIATQGAIVPAAVGVDIGCGMMAVMTQFKAEHLPDTLAWLRSDIESRIPVGMNWFDNPTKAAEAWEGFEGFFYLPKELKNDALRPLCQLGTLGTGNHFVEVCLDTDKNVWVMLHSGSRGIGNRIGSHYIESAKKLADVEEIKLNDPNLAHLNEDEDEFQCYWRDLQWAQSYAMENRRQMMTQALAALGRAVYKREGGYVQRAREVNCHHNYAERELHFGSEVIVTRKGAVRARTGDMGIIPGSMGTRSYIVKGLGNPDSFCSCSHGAGRKMSRTGAKKVFSVADARQQTEGVECKKDASIIDELPGAYKKIEEVMAHQSDLVEIVAELKQVLCVKG